MTIRAIKIEKFIIHRSWIKYLACLQGKGDQGREQTDKERQNLGHMTLLGSVHRVLWSTQAKARWVNSSQKS